MEGYAHEDPFDSGFLSVGSIHKIHYEQYGKKDGKPVIFLHGGPGGKTRKRNTKYFDPAVYRVVLLDQRGAGQSLPAAELRENTSQHLVSDLEALRTHLGVEKWYMVFGGSWGSTLALLYAETHPESVGSLVIRGIFTVRKIELDWHSGPFGASMLFPEKFEEFVNYLPPEDRGDPYAAYRRLLTSDDRETRLNAAKAWNNWEMSISRLIPDESSIGDPEDDTWQLQHARMEMHYETNGAFLEEGQLLKPENIDKIRHIPCTIVQGRYDIVCPPRTAWDLHKALPVSKLYMIADAGHTETEPGTTKKLLEICDEYAKV